MLKTPYDYITDTINSYASQNGGLVGFVEGRTGGKTSSFVFAFKNGGTVRLELQTNEPLRSYEAAHSAMHAPGQDAQFSERLLNRADVADCHRLLGALGNG